MRVKESKKRFLIIDGYALIYRSYFAFINRPIRDSAGRNVSAVYGFFNTLLSVAKEFSPDYLCVALDSITPTFRHELYAEYKAKRDKTPEDLHAQIPLIERGLKDAGISMVREEGLEADDLIATLAGCYAEEGVESLILSGDKDLMQLVNDSVLMVRPVKGENVLFDAKKVKEHFGIRPDQIVDYLSLIGDASDNIPGVRGIGPKGAVKLLEEYETLDGVYEHLGQISKGMAKKLEESRASAYMSRDLVVLRTDGACRSDALETYSRELVDMRGAIPLFTEIQSSRLIESVGGTTTEARNAKKGSNAQDTETLKDSAGQQELFSADEIDPTARLAGTLKGKGAYQTVTTLEELDRVLEEALVRKEAAFDCESTDIDPMKAVPVGFSISTEPRSAYYIPLRAGGSVQLDEAAVKERLKKFLENPELNIIGQNFKYDYKLLCRWGITPTSVYFDTMIAAWLIDSTDNRYNMDRLAAKYLDYTTVHYDDIVPKGSLFSDVELGAASNYAAEDADITYRLYLLFNEMLRQRNLTSLMHEVEMPLLTILADMEIIGMGLNPEYLEDFAVELKERLGIIQQEIYTECGHEFNINSTKQLQEVLFEERGLKPIKKTKTGYSTNVAVLEELSSLDPVPRLILEHRSLEKLRNTYVESLPTMVNPETGRIHTTLIQTGTATGRLSSKDPNLQNIPIRSEDGRRIRTAFVPAYGYRLLSADYSQIELVVLAHFADDPGLKEAFLSGTDVHRHTGAMIFGVGLDDVTSEQRRIAKTINFGVMYGMSAFRLSRELGIPRSDADAFIQAYFTRYSGVRGFVDATVAEAEGKGYVSTLLGHERVIPGITSKNRNERMGAERIAVNTPIQGSAADIMKLAMLRISKEMKKRPLASRMVLQVHDELIFEVPEEELETMKALVQESMIKAVTLKVPLRVSIEDGMSWGDLH